MKEVTSANQTSRRFWLIAPLLILVAAVGYYGSYIEYWFNPHDEGGTAAFIAMRMLGGEAAYREIELGYNVGWFWPIVGLFKTFGVNFLLMRGYFFALSAIAAICGWAIVRRVTGNEWLALFIGLLLVVFPGSQFKNYIPLVCLANGLGLVHVAAVRSDTRARFWSGIFMGGIVLGITFLIRIDIGYLCAVMWVGLVALRLFDVRFTNRDRWLQAAGAFGLLIAALLLTHLPAYAAARGSGYGTEFRQQYKGWANFLRGEAGSLVSTDGAPVKSVKRPAMMPKPGRKPGQKPDRTTLPRVNWDTFISFASDKSALFLLTYFPPLIYAILVGWAAISVARQMLARTFTLDQRSTVALLLLGASLTTFAQFFFFRPDRPHLSEFMPGFIVSAVSTVWMLPGILRRIAGGILACQIALFGWFALDHYSAGTIAARTTIKRNKRVLFNGANGVRVKVHQKTYAELEGVRKAVTDHSKPGEWLVCYPYQPGYNVMTNRPSYERELYNDNATAPRDWWKITIANMQDKQPAVVIIDDRAINQVEASRFSRWAAPVYEYVKNTYGLVGKIDTIEIYSRDTPPTAVATDPGEDKEAKNP